MLLCAATALAQQQHLGAMGANEGINARVFRGQIGRRVTFVCPATATDSDSVWGTDTYADDSKICPAAIHAGVLQPGKAGSVTFVMGSAVEALQGSTRNGVTSQSYGA